MYMREPRGDVPVSRVPLATSLAIAICMLLTLYLGVLPSRILNYATLSAHDLVNDAPPRDMAGQTLPGNAGVAPQ
jgi:NADH:ubiquinone oxidoreductase subunit 2 (subunit N)